MVRWGLTRAESRDEKEAFVFVYCVGAGFGWGVMPKVTEAHLEARRQQVLDPAFACFARQGFHQTTMDDICREAGLSAGAL